MVNLGVGENGLHPRLVATSEPVLAAVLDIEGFAGPACGQSTVRVAPGGRVLPCTHWPESALTIEDVDTRGETIVETAEFVAARRPPAACVPAEAAARDAALAGALDAPDPYCPFTRGERMRIDCEATAARDLQKLGRACPTVVSAC